MRRVLWWCVFVLACSRGAPESRVFVAREGGLRAIAADEATVVTPVAPGEALQVFPAGRWDTEGWSLARTGSGAEGWVRTSSLVTGPLETLDLVVQARRTGLLPISGHGASIGERELGQRVTVVPAISADGFVALVDEGVLVGLVSRADLAPTPVPEKTWFTLATQALVRQEPVEFAALAALATAAKGPKMLALAAARLANPDAARLRFTHANRPAEGPGRARVGVPIVAVRGGRDTDAPVVTWLPGGSPVEVLEVEAGEARLVPSSFSRIIDTVAGTVTRTSTPLPVVEGTPPVEWWVDRWSLSTPKPAKPDPKRRDDPVFAELEALSTGEPSGATPAAAYEALLKRDPETMVDDLETLVFLFRGLRGDPVHTLVATPARSGTLTIESLDDVFGCRGPRAGASLLQDVPAEKPTRGTCLIDRFHAPPCEPDESCFATYDEDHTPEVDTRRFRAALAEKRLEIRAWEKEEAAARRAFPDEGGVRITLKNGAVEGGHPPLAAYVTTLDIRRDELGLLERGAPVDDEHRALPIGFVAPFETIEVWLPRQENGLGAIAVHTAASLQDARDRTAALTTPDDVVRPDLRVMTDFDRCVACD